MPENTGLYNKYAVRTPDEQPLPSGTFVLRPFNADGSVRDPAAVKALRSYADECTVADIDELALALNDWLTNPTEHDATKSLNLPVSARIYLDPSPQIRSED